MAVESAPPSSTKGRYISLTKALSRIGQTLPFLANLYKYLSPRSTT